MVRPESAHDLCLSRVRSAARRIHEQLYRSQVEAVIAADMADPQVIALTASILRDAEPVSRPSRSEAARDHVASTCLTVPEANSRWHVSQIKSRPRFEPATVLNRSPEGPPQEPIRGILVDNRSSGHLPGTPVKRKGFCQPNRVVRLPSESPSRYADLPLNHA